MAGGLLDMSLEQESAALGGEINEAEYGSKKWQQERVQREQARNAPIQLAAFLSGQATQGKVKDPTQDTALQKDSQTAQGYDDLSYEDKVKVAQQNQASSDAANNQDSGMSSLFGFSMKNLFGGFLGQSGGGGSGGAPSGGAAPSSGG